jgi:purine-cytosine permease-like protein
MIITGAMTGSVLVLGMGFQRALIAMIIGNLIMFAYVGALGALGTKKGMNFALIASIVFGRKRLRVFIRPFVHAAARLVCGADRHYRQSH